MIVRESISFKRDKLSIPGMNLGKAAVFQEIMREIKYDQLKPEDPPKSLQDMTESKMYSIDTRKIPSFINDNSDRPVIMELMNEIFDKVLTFNPNKLEHLATGWVNMFFRYGKEEEVWKNPKWITDYTFNEFRRIDLQKTIEKTKELGANKAFLLGYSRGERELEIWGIKNGATNTNTNYNEPIQNACVAGDLELVKLLLADPNVDPTCNTKDGRRYKNDETNFCIRRAAKAGHQEIVKLLLKDKRVNPASRNNWALSACLAQKDLEMCKLLLTDQRVRNEIFSMNNVSIDRFERYRKAGQL